MKEKADITASKAKGQSKKGAVSKGAATSAKGGRPPKYQTPEDLQAAIDAYYDTCEEKKKPPTWAGLVYSLGFASRQSMADQAARNDEFSDIVKKAKTRHEAYLEAFLYGSQCTGVIFNLKCNFKWRDNGDIEDEKPRITEKGYVLK